MTEVYVFVVGALAGALVTYFVLRRNPQLLHLFG